MGKFKTAFVACLGLGIAAGAGYYLYKKFLSKDGREDSSSAQLTAESENVANEDVIEKGQGGQEYSKDDNKEVDKTEPATDSSVDKDDKEVPKTEPATNSSVQDKQTKPTENQQRKKSNFGGLKKGFLL